MKKVLFCFISALLLTSFGNIFAQNQDPYEELGELPQTFYITKTKDPTIWGHNPTGPSTGASMHYSFTINEYTDVLIHTLGSEIPGIDIKLYRAGNRVEETISKHDYYSYWEANGIPDIYDMSMAAYGYRSSFFAAYLEPGEYSMIILGTKVSNYGWVNGPTTMHLAGYEPENYSTPTLYPPLYPNTKKDIKTLSLTNVDNVISFEKDQVAKNISVYSVATGMLMLKKDNITEGQIDLGNLPKGAYIINVQAGGETQSQKIYKR